MAEIYRLFEIPENLLNEVGGKARGLYQLHKTGLNVANGFILYGMETEADLEKAAAYYETSGLSCVAVRSSAKGEDGTDFSSAGQYSTILNVSGKENFIQAVKECLASVHSDTAKKYADTFLAAAESSMTVVVQEMVAAKKSGVCFTADPTGNHQEVLVEAVAGFGEALVSGKAAAQQYRLMDGPIPEDLCGENSILTKEELDTIKTGALAARKYFGMELDTEWAIDQSGTVIWLQARPITTEDTPTINELDCKRDLTDHVVTTCNIGEMMPGVVTPLTLSTSVYGIDWGIRKMLVTVGVYPSMRQIPPTSGAFSIGNTLFMDLTTLYAMEKRIIGVNRHGTELAICGRILEDAPETDFPEASVATKLRNATKYGQFLFSVKKKMRQVTEIAENLRIEPSEDPVVYYRNIDEALPNLNEALYCHYASSAYSGAMSSALYIAMEKDFSDKAELKAKIAGVLENIDGIESVDILRSLRKIARAILEEYPEAATFSAEKLAEVIHQDTGAIQTEYQAFLSRHGHRAIREAELRSKAWKDDETALMEYLRVVLASGGEETAVDRNSWLKNQEDLLSRYPKKSAKKGFGQLIKLARKGVQYREYTKSMIIKVIDPFKLAYRALAKQMVERKLLVDEDCIFFLTHEEIGRLVREQDTALLKKALARRRLQAEQKQLSYPEVCIGRPKAIPVESQAGGTVFQGVPVSRGIAVGKARVVKSVEDAKQLEKGEIMVASFTDIGWSPYYCMINGLITEIGSALSHGAVVAREYSLPLVVNLPNITAKIQTGDYVSVNGTTGTVTILEEEEALKQMEMQA